MRGRGFEPHTKRMLNAGNGLQPLNMKRQEITILLQIRTHLRFGFLRSTAPRGAGIWSAGDCYCLGYRMPALPTQGTGLLFLY